MSDKQGAIAAGVEIITLTAQEMARWAELAKTMNNNYVASVDAKGLPGTKVFNEIQKFVKEYKK